MLETTSLLLTPIFVSLQLFLKKELFQLVHHIEATFLVIIISAVFSILLLSFFRKSIFSYNPLSYKIIGLLGLNSLIIQLIYSYLLYDSSPLLVSVSGTHRPSSTSPPPPPPRGKTTRARTRL